MAKVCQGVVCRGTRREAANKERDHGPAIIQPSDSGEKVVRLSEAHVARVARTPRSTSVRYLLAVTLRGLQQRASEHPT